MLTEYRLSEQFLRRLPRFVVARTLPVILLVLSAGAYVGTRGSLNVSTFGPTALLMGALMVGTVVVTARRQRKVFGTLRIILSDESCTRLMQHHLPLEIRFTEITRIVEAPAKGMVVQGTTAQKTIAVPRALEGHDDLRARLALVHTIEAGRSANRIWVYTIIASLAAIGCMVIIYSSSDARLAIPCATALIVGLVWSMIVVNRSPHTDRRLKRSARLVAIVVLTLLVRIWGLLSQGQ